MTVMSDDAPSRMIRVPTPLVDTVRELSRLHRQGRTKAVIERSQKVITAIDSETVIDIDSVSETLSKVTEWQGKMELDMAAITLTIQDLITRVTELEEVRDINSDNASISKVEAPFDSRSDIEMTADLEDIGSDNALVTESREPDDIATDSVSIADVISPPQALELEGLSQTALGKHLINCSEKIVARQRKKGKESFALWSRDRDPDGKAWTWEGDGGRGEPYRYIRLE